MNVYLLRIYTRYAFDMRTQHLSTVHLPVQLTIFSLYVVAMNVQKKSWVSRDKEGFSFPFYLSDQSKLSEKQSIANLQWNQLGVHELKRKYNHNEEEEEEKNAASTT